MTPIKVLFVCHGNICRSPMAEYIFKDMVRKAGLEDEFEIHSAATSREEIGNDIYPPAKAKLREKGIPFDRHHARQITMTDCSYYDYLILMDDFNIRNFNRMFDGAYTDKVHLLLDFSDDPGNVTDPWYTGNFETTYQDIVKGCKALLYSAIQSVNAASLS